MDETLIFPSPNWFLRSNLAVSTDGWLLYGGPSKSICVLEPINQNSRILSGNQSYRAHVASRAHREKVLFVDVSPEFAAQRNFLSGGEDGAVKQWTLEKIRDNFKIKATHSHEIHYHENESIAGIGYSSQTVAITVGSLGNIVKWDLNTNACKTYTKFVNNYKPNCMACSPHLFLHIAIGTKQGVIFVLNLEGLGNIVYKVRGQDDEIIHLSWCPQYELIVNRSLGELQRKSTATQRLEAIRNATDEVNILELSGTIKVLPEDSFDETVVEEDDTFDIYKDHEKNEFGHKKYEPEDIIVKVKEDKSNESDYLAECLKLKEDILRRKMHEGQSIESLVEAMDKTHVDATSPEGEVGASDKPHVNASTAEEGNIENMAKSHMTASKAETSVSDKNCDDDKKIHVEVSVHPHKHLLATMSKFGSVRIWSKSGKQVAFCVVPYFHKNNKTKINGWPTILWYKPDTLLLVDARSQLLKCNPLLLDSKNCIDYRVVHSLHKRGLYGIVSDAPRVQTAYDSPESPFYYESEKWSVYTIAQDRNLIRYSLKNNKALDIHNTSGGFIYNVRSCPYDAGKIAIGVGDGAVRVWQSTTVTDDDSKLYPGKVQAYWQNVKGKVLSVAWHPTKENLLAFGTGESRVGLLDTSGKSERPAQTLNPAFSGGIYSLSWGEGMQLYVCGGIDLVVYNASEPSQAPTPMEVIVEGEQWDVAAVNWSSRGMLVGSHRGGVAVLDPYNHKVKAIAFPFSKMIHSMDWHPLQTSHSSEESPYKNLIAVSSPDKSHNIYLLEYKDKEDGACELVTWKTLSGHKASVLQIEWSPHRDELLLSTSQDTTVRVWNILSGECISIFGNHSKHSLGASWLAMPQFDTKILSGGGDCCLRLWDINDHKPENYKALIHETNTKSKKIEKKTKKRTDDLDKEDEKVEEKEGEKEESEPTAHLDVSRKPLKKYMLRSIHKQISSCNFTAVWRMYQKFFDSDAKGEEDNILYSEAYKYNFVQMFGSINDINELLDKEMERMLEMGAFEPWVMLSIFRGNIDAMLQYASQNDMITPYLLSMAPCVSFKYWKDAMQLYVAQIDRMMAKGEEEKLCDNRSYGGAVYRKVATLLSIHDIKGAVAVLTEAKLFIEAYLLCRIRYMDSIAEETLRQWAKDAYRNGTTRLSAICYMALGDLSEAAHSMSKCHDRESLYLAAELAKLAGRTTFAEQMEQKANTMPSSKEKSNNELSELPSRTELLMKVNSQTDAEVQNCDKVIENGNKTASEQADEILELKSKMEHMKVESQIVDEVKNDKI